MKFITILILVLSSFFSHASNAETNSPGMNNEYAMVFFFRSDCPWCHKFAPNLKQFTEKNRLFTYAFSMDGQGMSGFEVPIPATREISEMFFSQPRSITVPATFLINVNSQKFVKVSIGAVSSNDLQTTFNNIMSDPETLEALK